MNVTYEIILTGDHPDICVHVSASPEASEEYLLEEAKAEAFANTYIWGKRVLKIPAGV